MKKKFLLFILLIFPVFNSFSSDFSYLLEKYLEADNDIAKLKLELEQARIDLEKYNIQNGLNFKAQTGSSTLYRDGSETVIDMEPSVTVTVPDAHNTELQVKVPVIIGGSREDAGVEATLSRDLLPAKKTTVIEVQRLALERAVTMKERSYTSRCNEAEQEFLSKLRDLFSIRIDALNYMDDYNEANENFQLVRTQGYTSDQTEYQDKELLLRTASREYDEKMRLLDQGLKQLANDCDLPEIDGLPEEIPEVELLSINDFDIEKYKEYENSLWDIYYNSKERESTEPGFKLNGKVGYAYGDMGSNDYLREKNHSVLTGVGMSWRSLSADVGLKIPVTDLDKTAISFAVTWTPNQSKLDKLDLQYDKLSLEKDQINIDDALDDYSDTCDEMITSYKDLEWKRTQYAEEEDLYYQLYQKYDRFYKSGVVTKLKYDESRTHWETSKITNLALRLDRLIYNKKLINLFIEE
ncbi:MAG: hypothetical protein MJ215_02205 [Spirochaetia bacterium]|nr:hypothetical protein [Spirochaetia bacterium]